MYARARESNPVIHVFIDRVEMFSPIRRARTLLVRVYNARVCSALCVCVYTRGERDRNPNRNNSIANARTSIGPTRITAIRPLPNANVAPVHLRRIALTPYRRNVVYYYYYIAPRVRLAV